MARSLVEQQFGAHAGAYATSAVHAQGESLHRLVAALAPKADWQTLDVATGAGHVALALAPLVARSVAADLTAEMLAEVEKGARAKGLANVETVRADAAALPFESGVFDAVTCRIAAHHFPDPARFVAEAARVLKRGGNFGLVDNLSPDEVSLPGCREDEIAQAGADYNSFERLRDPSHGRALRLAEWRQLALRAGLEIRDEERIAKRMVFEPWARRLGAPDDVVANLRALLVGGPPALRRFLRPEGEGAQLAFHLEEMVLIARKPA